MPRQDLTLKRLLDAGANVAAQGKDGRTARMEASMNGDVGTVRALLASGADPAAQDTNGRKALSMTKSASVRALLAAAAVRMSSGRR